MASKAADWLVKLGRKGFETLISDTVNRTIDKALGNRVEPRLAAIENRMSAIGDRMSGLENRMSGIEDRMSLLENSLKGLDYKVSGVVERLNVTERLSKLEAEMAVLKAKS